MHIIHQEMYTFFILYSLKPVYSPGDSWAAFNMSALILWPLLCWRLMYFYYNLCSKVVQIVGTVTLCLRHLNAVDTPDTAVQIADVFKL